MCLDSIYLSSFKQHLDNVIYTAYWLKSIEILTARELIFLGGGSRSRPWWSADLLEKAGIDSKQFLSKRWASGRHPGLKGSWRVS